MSLNGKHALITGSSRGIGRGIALKLAASGVNVAVHYYQNEAAAIDTLAQVRKCGADGLVVQADVCRPEQITQMFRKVQDEFGKLDIFVSNARPDLPGFYHRPLDITLEQWQMALDSQARAFLLGAQQSARAMPDGGRILAITYSPGGRTGSWQPWVEGGVLRVLPQEIQEAIRVWHEGGWTPMGRLGTPEDVGNAVMLLCMDEASFITGQILHVDGGGSIMDTILPLDIQRG